MGLLQVSEMTAKVKALLENQHHASLLLCRGRVGLRGSLSVEPRAIPVFSPTTTFLAAVKGWGRLAVLEPLEAGASLTGMPVETPFPAGAERPPEEDGQGRDP